VQALTVDDIQRIHHATLNVLANPGVTFHTSPEAVAILEGNGCRSDGFRVCFPEELVAECLARLPHRDDLTISLAPLAFSTDISPKQGESHVGLIGNAYYVYDYEKRARRDCVEADLDDKFLILDSLRNFECDCCNLVFHSERHGGRVWASYESVSASAAFIRRRVTDRSRVAQLTQRDLSTLPVRLITRSDEERKLEVLGQMVLQGAEPTLALLSRLYVPFAWCNPISPLQYFSDETNAILRVAESQHPSRVIMISPDIMMGATGPVTLAGTLVQHNAEVMAGVVLAQLVGPGTPVIYGCVSTAMDLRVAEISMGHFETNMLNAAAVQLADHYGMPSRIAAGNTSANEPGVRAAVEAAVGLYMGLTAGANIITTGLLDGLLMISYEHLVLMDELIDQVKQVAGGIETNEDSLAVDVIRQFGRPSSEYLSSEHTLQFMKRDIYYSDYVGRTPQSYQDWYDRAQSRVNEILDRKRPAGSGEGIRLDRSVEERLAAVEARLTEDNETWRQDTDDWWEFYFQDL
jgi:trimethylamine--corrinoid protein Co-methyltransferase